MFTTEGTESTEEEKQGLGCNGFGSRGRKGKVDPRLALFAGSGRGALGFWGFGFGVFGDAEFVSGVESTSEDVFGGGGETDVGHAHAAPTTGDGKKDFGEIGDESLLLFEGEHEIAVALLGGG